MSNSRQTEAAVREAIESLYSTFAPYALGVHVDGCPCCVTDEMESQIRSTPLRELHPNELQDFGRKAMTTWGEVEDFKHFLPRLFEIQTFSLRSLVDSEVLFGKLDYGDWQKWPDEEQASINRFLNAFWEYTLTVDGKDWNIKERLCAIACTGADLTPLLRYWESNLSQKALMHLADLIYSNAHRLTEEARLGNAFWEEHDKQLKQVITWLFAPATAEAFESAILIEDVTEIDSAGMDSASMFFTGVKARIK